MEVIINRCHGGFSLSNEAIERCIKLGMAYTTYYKDREGVTLLENPKADFIKAKPDQDGNYCYDLKYFVNNHTKDRFEEKLIRVNKTVINVVKELGKKANGINAELEIVDIPFSNLSGWHISDRNGIETIEEEHRTWPE